MTEIYRISFEFICGGVVGFDLIQFTKEERKGAGWIVILHFGIFRIFFDKTEV